MQIIERLYGMLEIHSESQADVRAAGAAILDSLELKEEDRYKPVIYSSSVIRQIDDYHTMLINRTRHGNMILPGPEPVHMEVAPAAYAAFAANEAEKTAEINILEIRAFGSFGRDLPRRRGKGHRGGLQSRRSGHQQPHRPRHESQRRRLDRFVSDHNSQSQTT